MLCRRVEFEYRDLRRRPDADRRSPRAGSVCREHRGRSEMIDSGDGGGGGEIDYVPQRPHLAAMCVSGELEIDAGLRRFNGLIRLVRKEKHKPLVVASA